MQHNTYSFVVRVWQEAVDGDARNSVWRGSIDDVSNGERAHFCDLESILPIIRNQLILSIRSSQSTTLGKVD